MTLKQYIDSPAGRTPLPAGEPWDLDLRTGQLDLPAESVASNTPRPSARPAPIDRGD